MTHPLAVLVAVSPTSHQQHQQPQQQYTDDYRDSFLQGIMILRLVSLFAFLGLIWILTSTEASTYGRFDIQERFLGNNESVFSQFNELTSKYKPWNLGEGKPNYRPPEILSRALADAALGNWNLSQYSRNEGLPRLTNAISKFYARLLNRTLDPMKEVIVTIGATQALYTTFLTHTVPGDEWIIIEPAYSAYEPMIRAAYGVPRFVALKPTKTGRLISSRDWTFDRNEMTRAFNKRTKGIVINTPHNPLGKVFTRKELEFIARLAKKWNTLVVSDEVYQFLTYDKNEHTRIATLPGMFERTITIGSGGKAFSATGLRLGWAFGDSSILENLRFIHEHITLNAPTPIQEAFAVMFEEEDKLYGQPDSYLREFKETAEKKRNNLTAILKNFGVGLTVPEGGYFMVANWTPLKERVDLSEEIGAGVKMDTAFVKWMIKEVRVQALPMSAFYSKRAKNMRDDSLRFTFVKTDDILEGADKQFRKWKENNQPRRLIL